MNLHIFIDGDNWDKEQELGQFEAYIALLLFQISAT